MTQLLERMVEDAIDIRERRHTASSLYNWLKSRLDTSESLITERLQKRDVVRTESGLYAVLDKEQSNRAAYMDIIGKFCEQHPEYRGDFDKMVNEQKNKLADVLNYGKLEERKYKKP